MSEIKKEEVKTESIVMGNTLGKDPNLSNPWFKRFGEAKKETAELHGAITDESGQTTATLEIGKQVVQGAEFLGDTLFMRKFQTNNASFVIPRITCDSFQTISAGVFASSSSIVTGSTVLLNVEYGQLVSWSRAYIEDASYDVMAEQNICTGQALKNHQIQLGIDKLTGSNAAANPFYTGAAGAYVTYVTSGSPLQITMADLNTLIYKAENRGYGKVDTILCGPSIYYQLLNLEELTSALYNGGSDVMGSGVLKTTFGIDIIKTDNLTTAWNSGASASISYNWIIALNRQKCLGLVERRGLTIEPFSRPESNLYGYVASARYTVAPIWAIAGVGPFWTGFQQASWA